MNINKFSHEDIADASNDISSKITDKKYDCLLGINRGGVILCTHMSYSTGIPSAVINFQYKDPHIIDINKTVDYKHYFNICENIATSIDLLKCKNILIIDDDCDSGYMLTSIIKYLRERYPHFDKIDSAVISLYTDSEFVPTYFYRSFQYGYSQYPWSEKNTLKG
jgi:hypoxanthine phosphoribosyltransferase